jgi:molybdopterin molybdotransferase
VSAEPIAVETARRIVVESASRLEAETVPLSRAHGRVLAEDVLAVHDVPAFANSAMDGYAVAGGVDGGPLRVVDEARAGRPARRALRPGEAIRISTGAAVPEGTVAVVPVEHAEAAGGEIVVRRAPAQGANVRRAGEDLRRGERVLVAGEPLGPAQLGVAVSAGRAEVACARRPRVALVGTGDELVPAGAPLGPGQVHDSNATMLCALAAREGADVTGAERVRDDREATRAALERALGGRARGVDVALASGGVSVGPHDHVREALEALGVEERFWRVAMKPGKPLWFGMRGRQLVFGLPGNPVSAVVCFLVFVRPALRALQGRQPLPRRERARLVAAVRRTAGREQAVRVALEAPEGELLARPTGPQGSHVTSSLRGADALAWVPAGEGELEAGALVDVERIA